MARNNWKIGNKTILREIKNNDNIFIRIHVGGNAYIMKELWQSLGLHPIYRLMNSDQFHYFIYAVMSYPFAWLIAREKVPEI